MNSQNFNNFIDYFISENPFNDPRRAMEAAAAERLSRAPWMFCSDYIFHSDDHMFVSIHDYDYNHYGPHSHDYFELIYVSRGFAHQTLDQQTIDIREGDICILNPTVIHEIATSSRNDLLFNVLIKKSLFKESFLCLLSENFLMSNFFITSLFTLSEQNNYLYFPREHNLRSAPFIEALITEFLMKKIGYQKAMECYLALLFTELLREHTKAVDRENYATMGNHALSDILGYINKNKASATLESVAEAFHYNPSYLSTLIKNHTKKSFSTILQEAKLEEAKHYLKYTAYSIDKIARLAGYSDRNYFHRVFKKTYGITPLQYREQSSINP